MVTDKTIEQLKESRLQELQVQTAYLQSRATIAGSWALGVRYSWMARAWRWLKCVLGLHSGRIETQWQGDKLMTWYECDRCGVRIGEHTTAQADGGLRTER